VVIDEKYMELAVRCTKAFDLNQSLPDRWSPLDA
jgi:hypothetical protein